MKLYMFSQPAQNKISTKTRLVFRTGMFLLLFWPAVYVLGEHIAPGARTVEARALVPWEYLSAGYIKNLDAGGTQNLGEWLSAGRSRSPVQRAAAATAIDPNNTTTENGPTPLPGDVHRLNRAEQNLNGYLSNAGASGSLPGLAVGIYRNATPVFARDQGITRHTIRPIASVTKTFTAVAVLQLVESGASKSLDDPIGRYLPDLTIARAPMGGVTVTIRHLLQQNSGIPYGTSRPGQTVASPTRKISYYIPPQYGPAGPTFAYSNHNYYVLALLIETLSGKSYPEFVHENILKRAGMRESYVSATAAGASGVASSIADLALFAAALYSRESPVRLLRQRSIDEMMAVPEYVTPQPNMMYYGLGVRVQYYDGQPAEVYHTGIWTGIFAEVRYFPNHQATLIHLGNPPNFRSRGVNSYRADSVHLTAEYLRALDELLSRVQLPALARAASDS